MEHRARITRALLPVLLGTACGGSSEHAARSSDEFSIAPTATLEPLYAPADREVRQVVASFLKATSEYDARTAGRLDFLTAAEPLTTLDELARLANSQRANLPWRVLRDRGERTTLTIDGTSQTTLPTGARRVLVWITVTTHTRLGTLESIEQVRLTLVPSVNGWTVDDAHGAGL